MPLTISPPPVTLSVSAALIRIAPAWPWLPTAAEAWMVLSRSPPSKVNAPESATAGAVIAMSPPRPGPKVELISWPPSVRVRLSARLIAIEPALPVLPCSAVVRTPLCERMPPARMPPLASRAAASIVTVPPAPPPRVELTIWPPSVSSTRPATATATDPAAPPPV